MAAYVDEAFYTNTYGGFIVPSNRITFYANKATRQLNSFIGQQLTGDAITDEVRNATAEMMDCIYQDDNNDSNIVSERIGTYQRTFDKSNETQSVRDQCFSIAVEALSSTGLLYRGATYYDHKC